LEVYDSFDILILGSAWDTGFTGAGTQAVGPSSLSSSRYEIMISSTNPLNVSKMNEGDLIFDHGGRKYKVEEWQNETYSSGVSPSKGSFQGDPLEDAYSTSSGVVYIKVLALDIDEAPIDHGGTWSFGSGGASMKYVEPVAGASGLYEPQTSWVADCTSVSKGAEENTYNASLSSLLVGGSVSDGKMRTGYFFVSASGYIFEIIEYTKTGNNFDVVLKDINESGKKPVENSPGYVYESQYQAPGIAQGTLSSYLSQASLDTARNQAQGILWRHRGSEMNLLDGITKITFGDGFTVEEEQDQQFPITGGNRTNKEIRVSSDIQSLLQEDSRVRITLSTGNDGVYSVESATYTSTYTSIILKDELASDTFDGDFIILSRGWKGGRHVFVRSTGTQETPRLEVTLNTNTEWTIPHTFSTWYPTVTVVDSAGTLLEVEVTYAEGQVTLRANSPFSGTAVLS
jgi:hypothetical protein